MFRYAFATLVFMAPLQSLATRRSPPQETSPSVSISLPSNVPSEMVQIFYHMVGPFGGSGGQIGQKADLHSYHISTSVDGKAATEIKMIIYAQGCEIEAFVVPLEEGSRVKKEFECQPVRRVTLSGQIVPNDLILDKNAELVINYLASWSHAFFGITDGPVAVIRLATVIPDASGMFQVDLPEFREESIPSASRTKASLRLMLRDSKTWNPIAHNLEPELAELRSEDHGLRIRPDYPSGLKFIARPLSKP